MSTFIQALQLLFSSDSAMVPERDMLLSAQRRTDRRPVVEKVIGEEFKAAPPPEARGPAECTEICVKEGLPPPAELESWKKLLKLEPVEAPPILVTVPEKMTDVSSAAELGPEKEAVRSG